MGKISKEKVALIDKESDDVFKLLLKKTGMTYNRLIQIAKQEFVVDNIDRLTDTEKKQFKHIAL